VIYQINEGVRLMGTKKSKGSNSVFPPMPEGPAYSLVDLSTATVGTAQRYSLRLRANGNAAVEKVAILQAATNENNFVQNEALIV